MSVLTLERRGTLTHMGEDWATLGAEIRDRIDRYGMSVADLAELTDVTRGTLYAVFEGKSRPSTVHKVLRALKAWEDEQGIATVEPAAPPEPSHGLVTFELQGNFGVSATVKGPVEDVDVLRQQVERLLEKMSRPERGDSASES